MSSPSNLVITMKLVEKYLYQVACPTLMFIGTVGCIINLFVFTQKTLRKNPCSIYFIAYNCANFIYIFSSLLALTLNIGYKTSASIYYLSFCRVQLYIVALFNCLSPFYLILASIDRILVTSRNAVIRRRSTRRFAYQCILVGTLFWALFHCHLLIFATIIQVGPNSYLCYYQPGAHLTFMGYYSISKEVTALLLLLTICGLWSIKNIRTAHRVRPAHDLSSTRTMAENVPHSTAGKDRQLIYMLLMDISIYGLFSFVFAIFLMYQQITQNQAKSPEQVQIEGNVRSICLFSAGVTFCLDGYTNILVSKAFRSEVKKIFSCRRFF